MKRIIGKKALGLANGKDYLLFFLMSATGTGSTWSSTSKGAQEGRQLPARTPFSDGPSALETERSSEHLGR